MTDALTAGASAYIEQACWRRRDGAALMLACQVSPIVLDGRAAGAVIVFRAPARA